MLWQRVINMRVQWWIKYEGFHWLNVPVKDAYKLFKQMVNHCDRVEIAFCDEMRTVPILFWEKE